MSQAWKNVERRAAKILGGKRVSRGADFSISDTDVKIDGLPWLKIDAKRRKKHRHHAMYREAQAKYEKAPEDVTLLVTQEHGSPLKLAVVKVEFFRRLLDAFRSATT